jgi:hypothetical protein
MTRAVRAFLGTVIFFCATPALGSMTGFAISGMYPGRSGEAAGWTGLALGFIGAPVGAVLGLVISLFGPAETWWRRCLLTAALVIVASAVLAVSSVKR